MSRGIARVGDAGMTGATTKVTMIAMKIAVTGVIDTTITATEASIAAISTTTKKLGEH
jgi:hypothetical protein